MGLSCGLRSLPSVHLCIRHRRYAHRLFIVSSHARSLFAKRRAHSLGRRRISRPAYSHRPVRRTDVVRVHQAPSDCGRQSDNLNPSASCANMSRKSVRIARDMKTVTIADTHASSSRCARKSVPFLDLRSMQGNRKTSANKHSRSNRVALCASTKPNSQSVHPPESQIHGVHYPRTCPGDMSAHRRPRRTAPISSLSGNACGVSCGSLSHLTTIRREA